MTTPSGTSASGHLVEHADENDAEVLTEVVADAFFALDVSQWLVPDPDIRRVIFAPYFRMYVEHALSDGLVHTTPARDAAALWLPVGSDGPGEPPEGYAEWLAEVTGRWVDRFNALDEGFERHHPVGTPHHHLAILAVRPGRQGQGTGSALLDFHHTVLDKEGVPAYLEASDRRTRALYLRHGYTDRGGPIDLPDGPHMWPMWRVPHSMDG